MSPASRRRHAAAAVVAAAGPTALVALAAPSGRWSPPPSPPGKVMLAAYVLAVSLVEETLYRAPVSTCARRGSRRSALAVAAASAACFVAVHVRRDGRRTLLTHGIIASSWTVSALIGRTVAWSVTSHAAYNYVAMSLRATA